MGKPEHGERDDLINADGIAVCSSHGSQDRGCVFGWCSFFDDVILLLLLRILYEPDLLLPIEWKDTVLYCQTWAGLVRR